MTDRTAGDVRGTAAKGPTELRDQIDRTRSQLMGTMAELMGRADMKGRAMTRAADLRDKAGAMTVQLRSSAAQAGHAVQDRATHAGHTVHDKATYTGHAVEHRMPRPVRTVVQAGLRHPRPVLVVGAALGALIAAGMLRRRGERHS
ncbi:DUF3618 domain-containing protein [Streptomyces lanatus]|uniref:DUF3618 domain-containing protein n=1 Tax=Streptomyces lanatus TaxID=66900 RepID=A0ABV1XNB2_9ACTN|nr:DUF3618 domain-containing protein [Streptomyces lanatus]GHH03496.1 alanine-rich protein [Streptomyces lanatus]